MRVLLVLRIAARRVVLHRLHVPRLAPARGRVQLPVRVVVVLVVVPAALAEVDPDVVVRELAHLRVVDAEDLRLLARAQAHAGDEVQDPQDDGRHNKRVRHARDRVGDLVPELDVVVVEPATIDRRKVAVERDDARLREQRGEDVTDDTADRMRRKDLRREDKCQLSVQRCQGAEACLHQDSRRSGRQT